MSSYRTRAGIYFIELFFKHLFQFIYVFFSDYLVAYLLYMDKLLAKFYESLLPFIILLFFKILEAD